MKGKKARGREERRRGKNGIDRSRCFPDCEPSETGRRENPDWLTVRTCSLNESKIAASSFAWMEMESGRRPIFEGFTIFFSFFSFLFFSYGFVFSSKESNWKSFRAEFD